MNSTGKTTCDISENLAANLARFRALKNYQDQQTTRIRNLVRRVGELEAQLETARREAEELRELLAMEKRRDYWGDIK